jgi:hypothetical protein
MVTGSALSAMVAIGESGRVLFIEYDLVFKVAVVLSIKINVVATRPTSSLRLSFCAFKKFWID